MSLSLRTVRGAEADRPNRRGPVGIRYRCSWLLRLVSAICVGLVQAPQGKQPHACRQGRDRQQNAQRCHRYHGWSTVWPALDFGRAQELAYSLRVASSSPCHRHSPQVQCWPLAEIPAAAALSLLFTNEDGASEREILALYSYWIATGGIRLPSLRSKQTLVPYGLEPSLSGDLLFRGSVSHRMRWGTISHGGQAR